MKLTRLYYYTEFNEGFTTWRFEEETHTWIKNSYPSTFDTSEYAKRWYEISNIEDKFLLSKELEACTKFITNEFEEINILT